MRKKNNKEEMVMSSIRVERSSWEAFQVLCDQKGVSYSHQIRIMIKKVVDGEFVC